MVEPLRRAIYRSVVEGTAEQFQYSFRSSAIDREKLVRFAQVKGWLASGETRGYSRVMAMRSQSFLLWFLFFTISASAQVTFSTVGRETVEGRLRAYKGDDRQRAATLKQMFESVGCTGDKLMEQPVKHLREPNLICTLTGQSDSLIVVGAHYDHAELGEGVVDNWTGASLLPSLYEAMKSRQLKVTFVFAAFAGEEKGLIGSRFYVDQMSSDAARNVTAMICMDTLGLSNTEVWVTKSDARLVSALNSLAHALKLPLSAVNVDRVGDSDEQPFAQRKIPVLVVHSLTQETLGILHSPKDTYKAVNFDNYYETYRLMSAYLALLDQSTVLRGAASK